MKNIRILNIDDGENKKDVLLKYVFQLKIESRFKTVIASYFKYPLSAKLVLDGLIPQNCRLSWRDSSKAKLLEPLPDAVLRSILNSKLAGGI